jgi:hypothetical protein
MRRLALLLALVLLAGCAGSSESPDPNPACDRKWNTLISMGRCLLGIQPPQDPPPRKAPQSTPSTPEPLPQATPSPPASTPPASKETAPAS